MRLDPDSLPFGVAPEILRDCATQLRELENFEVDGFCKAIGAPADEALPVFNQMVYAGFIIGDENKPGKYFGTSKLSQLALARITKGITRDAAEIFLEKVIERAKSINADPRAFGGRRIIRLAVFGSFLGDADVLGDIDIAFEYETKRERHDGRLQHSDLEESLAGERKMLSFLRLRKPQQISLHWWDELMGLDTPFRIVFEDEDDG